MNERRKREPFATLNLPDLPAWGRSRWRPRMAHLYYQTYHAVRPRVMAICGSQGACNPLDLMLAHPDDRRCKKCQAWAQKRKETE
jgi:hypothetical protein